MATKQQAVKEDVELANSMELAKREENALALAKTMQEDVGSGFEEADSSAYAIPFLIVLQSGSPQCKKSDGAYIKGAEEGMLYNTVTGELYPGDVGVSVVPCHYVQRFIEWKQRESGGGFVKEHMPVDAPPTEKDEKNRDVLENGNNLVDTRTHYVLMKQSDGSLTPAIMAFTSTQMKKSKQWMSKMQGIKIKDAGGVFQTAPMMSREYKVTTVPESNDKGSWFGYKIELAGLVEDPAVYGEAQAFRNAVRSGVAKPKYEAQEEDVVQDDSSF